MHFTSNPFYAALTGWTVAMSQWWAAVQHASEITVERAKTPK